jgi:uncharacterized protein involved in tolerance to divalent cations
MTSQFLCLHIFAAAIALYWWLRRIGASSERIVTKTTGSRTLLQVQD